jgi:hypothetical protein
MSIAKWNNDYMDNQTPQDQPQIKQISRPFFLRYLRLIIVALIVIVLIAGGFYLSYSFMNPTANWTVFTNDLYSFRYPQNYFKYKQTINPTLLLATSTPKDNMVDNLGTNDILVRIDYVSTEGMNVVSYLDPLRKEVSYKSNIDSVDKYLAYRNDIYKNSKKIPITIDGIPGYEVDHDYTNGPDQPTYVREAIVLKDDGLYSLGMYSKNKNFIQKDDVIFKKIISTLKLISHNKKVGNTKEQSYSTNDYYSIQYPITWIAQEKPVQIYASNAISYEEKYDPNSIKNGYPTKFIKIAVFGFDSNVLDYCSTTECLLSGSVTSVGEAKNISFRNLSAATYKELNEKPNGYNIAVSTGTRLVRLTIPIADPTSDPIINQTLSTFKFVFPTNPTHLDSVRGHSLPNPQAILFGLEDELFSIYNQELAASTKENSLKQLFQDKPVPRFDFVLRNYYGDVAEGGIGFASKPGEGGGGAEWTMNRVDGNWTVVYFAKQTESSCNDIQPIVSKLKDWQKQESCFADDSKSVPINKYFNN